MGKRFCRRKYYWCRKKGGTADAKALREQESVVEHLTISIPLNKVKLSTVDQVDADECDQPLIISIHLDKVKPVIERGTLDQEQSDQSSLGISMHLQKVVAPTQIPDAFSLLASDLPKYIPRDWVDVSPKDNQCVVICKPFYLTSTMTATVKYTVAFEKSLSDHGPPEIANSMLMFMVQGLFIPLQFPYCQFPCCSVTGDLLFKPIWEAVYRIERCGLQVLIRVLYGRVF